MRFFTLLVLMGVFTFGKVAVIKVDGMTCPLCTTAIKKSLKKVKGVIKAKVILNSKKATVVYDDSVKTRELLKAIERVGYKGKIINITNKK
jgi:mercuric ion binding protein